MTATNSHMISPRMTSGDWAQLLFLSLIWGGSFFLTGIAVRGLEPLTLVAVRISVAAVVLWAVVLARGSRIPRAPRIWGAFLVMGALNNAVPFFLIAWGQQSIPSGLASILNATTPLFTVLIGAAFLADERASARKFAGVLMGLAGVAVMMGLDTFAGQGHALLPQLAVLGAALSYAFAGAYGRRFRRMGLDPILAAAGMVSGAWVIITPSALLLEGVPQGVAAPYWLAAITIGIFGTGLAYIIYFNILARAGATSISLVTFLVPVTAILLGWLFLDEVLGPAHAIGMAMIALGLMLIDGRLMQWPRR
ncbi:DMT family transporter [Paracoccus sp. (in: a-proteobacteria)]|uniref:DMT family transporter n=1 Tax=Paracoccus sp. TaxID=267 RepID=UPI0035B4B636